VAIADKITHNITILEDGQIQLQRVRTLVENGVAIAEQYHRSVLEPGEDVAALPKRIRDICAIVWTPQVIADYRSRLNAERQRVGTLPNNR
jgi:hypothetical protein